MLCVLNLIVLFVMNFMNDNTLEGSFDNRRNDLTFHVVCFELYFFYVTYQVSMVKILVYAPCCEFLLCSK